MIKSRVRFACWVLVVPLWLAPLTAVAQYAPSGLSGAQLKKLHTAGVPIIAPVPAPRGFKVVSVSASAYDKTYKIVYQNKLGAVITFEGAQLYSSAAQAGATATAAPTTAPKRGIFQRIFAGAAAVSQSTPAAANANRSGTSSEAEGQAAAAIMADSPLIGPIRFTPVGPCLQGTSDPTKASMPGLRVSVSACNAENPESLISAYKSVKRV
jgi:hypothetical protein